VAVAATAAIPPIGRPAAAVASRDPEGSFTQLGLHATMLAPTAEPPAADASRDPEGPFTLLGLLAAVLGPKGGRDRVSATIFDTPAIWCRSLVYSAM
jgi:hypothetical protein